MGIGHSRFDVMIVGGGISALATAWYLRRAGRRVLIACNQDRIGGVIQTIRRDGWLFEDGPNSYASFGAEEDELLADIGLSDRALRRPIAKTNRFIWHSGRLHRVPIGPGQFLTASILPLGQRLRVLRGVFGKYTPPTEDVTVGKFFRGVLGDAAVDTLVRPGVAGIYAADADRISLQATFGKLYEGLRTNRRLLGAVKAMRGPKDPNKPRRAPKCLTSFPDGLCELPAALEATLRRGGVEFIGNADFALHRSVEEGWRLVWQDGEAEAPAVVLATPAVPTSQLIMEHSPEAARHLAAIEHTPLTVVHVGMRREDLARDMDGFGFLTRRGEDVRMLGSIWSSSIFPQRAPEGHVLMTCFYGGEIDPEVMDWPDDRLTGQLRQDLAKTVGYRGTEFAVLNIRRWKPALPVFRVGHADRIRLVKDALPGGLHLVGNYLGGVSIPDRIAAGRDTANRIADSGELDR